MNNQTGTKYLALFDLDRTIFTVNSSNYLVWHAFKKRLISISDLMKGIYLAFLYKAGWRETNRILNEMAAWIKGMTEKDLTKIAERIIESHLLEKIRPEIYHEIEKHQKKGAKVVILSAALPVLCQPIARHLKIHDVICTEMEVADGRYTGKSLGIICFAEEKLNRLLEYCNIHNFGLDDAYYYADSISDVHVLSAVAHPVCIDPDRKLRKAAKKNNWLIPDW